MKRARFRVLLFPLCVVAGMALAHDNGSWKTKAPEKWTLEEAQQVLGESPWVKIRTLWITPLNRQHVARYEVRIRSAFPIRMALAHSIASQPARHVRSARPPDPKALLRKADSFRVPNQLLISVRCPNPAATDTLNRQSLRTFGENAYIELEASGRKVHPIGYDAPWQNDLRVALFHFPRPTPEEIGGRITFVARFGVPNVVTLKVDFDLNDLRWHGHIEY